jgi:hypothetical protein
VATFSPCPDQTDRIHRLVAFTLADGPSVPQSPSGKMICSRVIS